MQLSPISPHISPPGGWSYTQPGTGVKFHSLSLQAIKNDVTMHRRAMSIPFTESDWLDELCQQNPQVSCHPNPLGNGYLSPLEIAGRASWLDLHSFSDSLGGGFSPESVLVWLESWEGRIPDFAGCACRRHWGRVKQELPVDTSSPEAFRAWCVAAHNKVNSILEKPQWPYSAS